MVISSAGRSFFMGHFLLGVGLGILPVTLSCDRSDLHSAVGKASVDHVVFPTLRYKRVTYFAVGASVEAGASVEEGAWVSVVVVVGESGGATTCVSGEVGCSSADTTPARQIATRTAAKSKATVIRCFFIFGPPVRVVGSRVRATQSIYIRKVRKK